MVKLDIINGFLGAGKTTLINKLLKEGLADENPVLIENEFGTVSIDHELISADVEVKLLASGCICCSMKGDFISGIVSVVEKFHPGRIIIEPTGLANLEDVIAACRKAGEQVPLRINSVITVVNAHNFLALMKVGGPFFRKQAEQACFALVSCTQLYTEDTIVSAVETFRAINRTCPVLTEEWAKLDALQILGMAEEAWVRYGESVNLTDGHAQAFRHEQHSHHENSEHHEHDEQHEHNHHEHHQAENYTSEAFFPSRCYSGRELEDILISLQNEDYGNIFRAKGFFRMEDGSFELLEYVYGSGTHTPCNYKGIAKVVVIGKNLRETLRNLFEDVQGNG